MESDPRYVVAGLLADPATAWSLGSFGAIAEFMRHADEPFESEAPREVAMSTARGGIRVVFPDDCRIVNYETPSRHPERRRKDAALCLPLARSAMGRRDVVTEIGCDVESLRIEHRGDVLFDVGLAQFNVDVLVRTGDPDTLAVLRAALGRSVLDPGVALMRELPRLSPHRVFVTRCGRIEVCQPIPPADGRSPDGPHTHVLPRLLAAKRTHAANIPIPEGLVPCLTAHLSRPDADHATILVEEGH